MRSVTTSSAPTKPGAKAERPKAARPKAARIALVLGTVALAATLGACAPQNTDSTYSGAAIGRTQSVSYGTIVGERPVNVNNPNTGMGTVAGAAVGGVVGSTIGHGGRWGGPNVVGMLGGAVLGGVAGNLIERSAGQGSGIEFIVREDGRGDIAVVQTNEAGLRVGDRVVIIRGDRTRLALASGPTPPPAPPPPPPAAAGYAPGYTPAPGSGTGYAPGYTPAPNNGY